MFELVTAEELKRRLSTGSKISIVDARRTDAYNADHIPGAVNMLWENWCEDAPANASDILHQPGWWGRLEDVSRAELEKKLGNLGLSSDGEIVVYADGIKSKGRDGRIAWMLLYFGAKKVSILNGGWDAWNRNGIAGGDTTGGDIVRGDTAGGDTSGGDTSRGDTTGVGTDSNDTTSGDTVGSEDSGEIHIGDTHAEKSSFVLNFDFQRRIQLKDLAGSEFFRGVDTRSREEHQGAIYAYQPRLGRIPNSVNIPFATLYKDDGKFLNQDEFLKDLRSKRVASKSEDNAGEAIRLRYSYCEVGVRAATFSLLYELYTGEILPVFDGSFMEWSYNFDLPIEQE
jgi:3-mercaptopyruvate sulfurtransferase SseA